MAAPEFISTPGGFGGGQGAAKSPRSERRSSERRGNVIALQSREARLRVIARAAGFGIYDLDCLSGEVRWSPELKAMVGMAADETPMSVEQLADFVHPEDRDRFRCKLRASLDPSVEVGEFDDICRLRRPDGGWRPLCVKGWTFFSGEGAARQPLGAMGILVERPVDGAEDALRLRELCVRQTELETQNEGLRRAQAASSSALLRYTELYDLAPVGYLTLGADGAIRQLNLAAALMFGQAREDMQGRHFEDFVEESDRIAFNAFVARVLADPAPAGGIGCEIVLADPQSPQHRHVVQMEARRDGAGEALDAVVVDITERKRVTDELMRSNLELQQFAYVAAHDLQTPLRSIGSVIQLLRQEYGGRHDEQADAWMEQVVRHVQRMQSLIQDLLAYSRLDSPSRTFEATDFNRLFDEVRAAMAATIAETGATVTRDELPTVTCNRVELAQVLQNLIDNGIKYRGKAPPLVHVAARRQDGLWVFAVCDNGIGVDAKHHRQIFELFSRLHSQQAYPGTGIGLAICQRVIVRHGGRIWLESEAGQGCTFFFSLPDRLPR